MAALKQKRAAQTAAPRRVIAALAVLSAALFAIGCDSGASAWVSTNAGTPGAGAGSAAAPAVADRGPAPGHRGAAAGGIKRLAQAGNQKPVGRQPGPAAAVDRPLVVIRFDRPNIPYETALYTAVGRALAWRPSAIFDVVAVSPGAGSDAEIENSADQALSDAQGVMRTLASMGLPADRVTLSSTFNPDIRDNEVRIYVR